MSEQNKPFSLGNSTPTPVMDLEQIREVGRKLYQSMLRRGIIPDHENQPVLMMSYKEYKRRLKDGSLKL